MRRRMLMDTKPTQDWVVAWDYTMGFPEDNGFTMTTAYISDNPEMTESGVLYRPPASIYHPYFEFVPTGYTTCNEAIFEADVKILEFNSGDNGMRLAISDSSSGVQIYVRSGSLYLQENRTQRHIRDLSVNVDYIFKIIRKDEKNEVYLDNDLIYESTVASSLYNTKTRVMFQNGGEYLLKAIRFKKYHRRLTRERRENSMMTAQHSTAQHSTAQHSTAQHSTAQHSTQDCNLTGITCQSPEVILCHF